MKMFVFNSKRGESPILGAFEGCIFLFKVYGQQDPAKLKE